MPECAESCQDRRRRLRWDLATAFLALAVLAARASRAQTIRVDATPGHAVNSFDPDQALGSSIDILHGGADAKVYSDPILKESLSAGWGPIICRQNTELQIAA